MKTFVIWNPDKICEYRKYAPEHSSETYEGLLEYESKGDGSLSSNVVTDDIDNLMAAIYNETDIQLCYQEVPNENSDTCQPT
jgi:hypothetical protein